MFQPRQHGYKKSEKSVYYEEAAPPEELLGLVHCFWHLKTSDTLLENFRYHVLPDACVDVIFDFGNPATVTIMTPGITSETLDLGTSFHYLGIRFLPGVWTTDLTVIIGNYKQHENIGTHKVQDLVSELTNKNFNEQQKILSILVDELWSNGTIEPDEVVQKVLSELDSVNNVETMAQTCGLSTRQLQRRIKQSTGFSPHDFLKVLRLQQSFSKDYLDMYTDQSHFIHSFDRITGYTPTKYKSTFDV